MRASGTPPLADMRLYRNEMFFNDDVRTVRPIATSVCLELEIKS